MLRLATRPRVRTLGKSARRFRAVPKRCASTSTHQESDVVIVGGGPACLALATALSSNALLRKSLKVVLVEAGDLSMEVANFSRGGPDGRAARGRRLAAPARHLRPARLRGVVPPALQPRRRVHRRRRWSAHGARRRRRAHHPPPRRTGPQHGPRRRRRARALQQH
ncbi:hypothetical protein FKP32DRAFT_812542 [Trametes sanguinea]|nr:hypothetical protein FKP32DRAFT_812542 [Trametes sanguinea]